MGKRTSKQIKFRGESSACGFIKAVCNLFHKDRAGNPGDIQAFIQESTVGRIPIERFSQSRFNMLFHNACGIFCLRSNIKVCLFVCGISLTSGQLIIELFPDCTRSCFSQVVSRRRGGDRIYEMRCLFVAVGPNARFIVLLHWDNMS